jgi:hypothetical protein
VAAELPAKLAAAPAPLRLVKIPQKVMESA